MPDACITGGYIAGHTQRSDNEGVSSHIQLSDATIGGLTVSTNAAVTGTTTLTGDTTGQDVTVGALAVSSNSITFNFNPQVAVATNAVNHAIVVTINGTNYNIDVRIANGVAVP